MSEYEKTIADVAMKAKEKHISSDELSEHASCFEELLDFIMDCNNAK